MHEVSRWEERELPPPDEWGAQLNLKRIGREWVGPCPVCNGRDRFAVRMGASGRPLINCRHCLQGVSDAERNANYRAILDAVWPDRDKGRPERPKKKELPPWRPPHPDPRIRVSMSIWNRAIQPPLQGPLRTFLAARRAWPPSSLPDAPLLPPDVRWLPAERADLGNPRWKGLPAGAEGAVVFAWRRHSDIRAVSLIALDGDGRRLAWGKAKTLTYGSRAGACFEARKIGAAVHVCEGELSALALCLTPDIEGRVHAIGGASSLPGAVRRIHAPIVLHAEGDAASRIACHRAYHARKDGLDTTIWHYRPGEDPNDALAQWIDERAAVAAEREDTGASGALDQLDRLHALAAEEWELPDTDSIPSPRRTDPTPGFQALLRSIRP